MSRIGTVVMVATISGIAGPVAAHHSYAVFDQTTTRTISGSVARLQWMNPHTVIWLYVPSTENPGKHDLWKFENDSPNVLARAGWGAASLPAGTKVTVLYFPLRDGSRGGHWVKGAVENGPELISPSSVRWLK